MPFRHRRRAFSILGSAPIAFRDRLKPAVPILKPGQEREILPERTSDRQAEVSTRYIRHRVGHEEGVCE
jgi:hypothetical protein